MRHIVIVGAGIVGAALADALAPLCRVTVIEATTAGQGTTAHSLAWINANGTLDGTYFAFRIGAMREWDRIAAEFGDPPWYVSSGNLMWVHDDKAAAELVERVKRLTGRDYPARLVTLDDVAAIEPAVRPPSGAVIAHFPRERFVHGTQAAHALLARARDAGASYIQENSVAAITADDDRVTGVRLAAGESISADGVICAAGWQSPRILASVGATIPLVDPYASGSPAPCLVAMTTAVGALRGVVHAPEVSARPAWNGGLLLEATDLDAATDMETPADVLRSRAGRLLSRFRDIAPALDPEVRVEAAWRCVCPLPDDGFPLIGWSRPGLYIAVTHSGVTLAPYLARLIAREMVDDAPADELSPYRPGRAPAHA